MAYRLTWRARRDVPAIWVHIAEDNEFTADSFVDLLTRRFRFLGEHPYAGRSREDLRTGYRSLPVGQYLILYRVMEPGIRIMHVLHGRRDIASLLGQ